MLDRFVFQTPPLRVVFGTGTIKTLGDELAARAMTRGSSSLCSKGRGEFARRIAGYAESRCARYLRRVAAEYAAHRRSSR